MHNLKETWRWFGASDPISLSDIKMTGVKGIVTALHEVPIGEIWQLHDIVSLKENIYSLQEPLAFYRVHSSSMSSQRVDLNISELKNWFNENRTKKIFLGGLDSAFWGNPGFSWRWGHNRFCR